MLDTSYLVIKRAYLASSPAHDLSFSLPAKRHPTLGSALTIQLGKAYAKGDTIQLVVEYATTDESTALGWLEKGQTDSGKYPFVYAQCQVRSLCLLGEPSTVQSALTLLPSLTPTGHPRPLAPPLPRHPGRQSHLHRHRPLHPPRPPLRPARLPAARRPRAAHRRHRPHDDVGAEERHPELPHWDRRRRTRLQVVGKAHGRVGPAGRD